MNVESFEVDGWEQLQTGVTVAESKDWLLVKHIPVDYILDGFKLYNKKFIKRRINSFDERFTERVLKLKGTVIKGPEDFKFADTIDLLRWSQDKFGLLEFQDDEETALFYGRIKSLIDNILIIDFVDKKGNVDDDFDCEFKINEIRTISFDSDYFNAIRVLWMDENPSIATL